MLSLEALNASAFLWASEVPTLLSWPPAKSMLLFLFDFFGVAILMRLLLFFLADTSAKCPAV